MQKAKAIAPAGPSSRYRFFTWAVAFLALAQLAVGLDYITIWPGAEAEVIWRSASGSPTGSLAVGLLGIIPIDSEYWLLAYRVPGVLLYLLGLWVFFRWGAALFGRDAVELTLILTAASLLLPVLAKTASLDAWRLGLELSFWVAFLRYAKDPSRQWLLAAAGLGSLAVLTGQLSTLVLLLFWQVAYYRLLVPRNAALKVQLAKPFVFIYLVFGVAFLVSYLRGNTPTDGSFFYFNLLQWGQLRFFGYAFLGLAPFIGFALAAVRDLFYKIRRGEEQAQLVAIGLVGGLVTQSLIFPFLLVFITAKQVQYYFQQPNYPWQDWVKGGQVLHLILVFIGVVLALLGGYLTFQVDGFRAVMGCGVAYWLFSFVGVIGLYGIRRDYVLGGMTLAGLLAVLFFWIQVYPFVHLQRNWPERLTKTVQKLVPPVKTVGLPAADPTTLPLAPYLLRAGLGPVVGDAANATPPNDLSLRALVPADSTADLRVRVQGWSGLGNRGEWGGD
jgi:hypothetical protein